MIYIVYGQDAESVHRFIQIVKKDKKYINFDKQNTQEDLDKVLFTQSIFETPQLIVCQNFIKEKKLNPKIFSNFQKGTDILFWEEKDLTSAEINKWSKIANIKHFKLKNYLYDLLDNISPNVESTLRTFSQYPLEHDALLTWHITLRMLLLILAKMNFTREEASKVISRNIQDWQWQKITRQAYDFDLDSIKKLFGGVLKIDYLTKSGKSNLAPKDMFIPLLLKYLKA